MCCLCLSESHVCDSPSVAQHGAGVPTSLLSGSSRPQDRAALIAPTRVRWERSSALPFGSKGEDQRDWIAFALWDLGGRSSANTRTAGDDDKWSCSISASSSLQFLLLPTPCSKTFSCRSSQHFRGKQGWAYSPLSTWTSLFTTSHCAPNPTAVWH